MNLSDGTKSAEEAGMRAKRRVRQLTILVAVATLLVTAPGPAAGAGDQGAAAPRGTRLGQERPVAITLLTGDKVLLRQRSGRQAVQVVPARRAGARPASRSCRSAATSTSSPATSTTSSGASSTSSCSTSRRSSAWATPTPRRPACR